MSKYAVSLVAKQLQVLKSYGRSNSHYMYATHYATRYATVYGPLLSNNSEENDHSPLESTDALGLVAI